MPNRAKYLLYTPSQIEAFRTRFRTFIAKYRQTYQNWFQRFPMLEWVPLPEMDEKTAEAVIGLLCILYIDGEINLTVDETVTKVYRGPLTNQEYEDWLQKNCIVPKKKTGGAEL